MTLQLRTNLFQFDPEELSPVCQYLATDEYCHGWKRLTQLFKKPNLPTSGLEEVLGVVSGGPVWVNYKPDAKRIAPAIASVNPIPYPLLCKAIRFWAEEAVQGAADVTQFLLPGEPEALHASTLFADPKQSDAMYKVVPWMLADRMTQHPMESSKALNLRLCSDATLLAWDQPLTYANEKRRAIAMHAITTQLVLLNRCEWPYAAVSVHLSHILPQWRHPTHKIWFDTGHGISKFAIHVPPLAEDGSFVTKYSTVAPEVLKRLGLVELPQVGQGDLELAGQLRPVHAHLPPFWPVGNGAGPLFLDQASFHFRRSVTSAKPMLTRYVGKMMAIRAPEVDSVISPIKIAVVTAHTDIMARVSQIHEHLSELTPVFKDGTTPSLIIQQIQRPGAAQALNTETSYDHVKQWFDSEVLPRVKALGATVAIVESVPEVATKTATDPKHILRALFARHGIATQFLWHIPPAASTDGSAEADGQAPSSADRKMGKRISKLVAKRRAQSEAAEEDDVDYPALNSLLDAIRSTGFTPHPLHQLRGIESGVTVVSIYVETIRPQSSDMFLPVVTRSRIGCRELEVYCPATTGAPDSSTVPLAAAGRDWVGYQEGLCRIHASSSLLNENDAIRFINRAMLAPTSVAGAPLIVLMNAGLKKLYPGLNDGVGEGLPTLPQGAWAVRVRSDSQTALMTGIHSESPDAPIYIGSKIGVHQADHQPRVFYFTSYTKHYSRVFSQRYQTRYDIKQARLKDPWQQLGVTEFVVIQSGDFSTADRMALQIGLWCKFAPMWDGFLRLPSPLHAAHQIAKDHPVIERHRKGSF